MTHSHELDQQTRACIQNCLDCHRTCTETIAHCLQMGGKHAEPAHIRLLLDCAQICITSADSMTRTSHFHKQVCAACATICGQCAESCSQMAGEDSHMRQCAEACGRCEESCKTMSA